MQKKQIKGYHFFIIAIFILAMAWTALFGVKIPFGAYDFTLQGAPDMRFGIDIRGGVDAVFEPKDLGRLPTADELEAARTVIETRLDQKNILDRDVTVDKQNGFVIVRFPWKSDEKDFNPQQAIAELGQTAKLTFRDPAGAVVVDGTHVKRQPRWYDTRRPAALLWSLNLTARARSSSMRARPGLWARKCLSIWMKR